MYLRIQMQNKSLFRTRILHILVMLGNLFRRLLFFLGAGRISTQALELLVKLARGCCCCLPGSAMQFVLLGVNISASLGYLVVKLLEAALLCAPGPFLHDNPKLFDTIVCILPACRQKEK